MATNGENQTLYLKRLRESGGNRISFDLAADSVKAIEKIMARHKFASRADAVRAAIAEFAKARK